MNRRRFLRTIAAAVAAAVVPLPAPTKTGFTPTYQLEYDFGDTTIILNGVPHSVMKDIKAGRLKKPLSLPMGGPGPGTWYCTWPMIKNQQDQGQQL